MDSTTYAAQTTDKRQVSIIGAGVAGLVAALQFTKQNGFSCTVYELRDGPATIGGAVGIPCTFAQSMSFTS